MSLEEKAREIELQRQGDSRSLAQEEEEYYENEMGRLVEAMGQWYCHHELTEWWKGYEEESVPFLNTGRRFGNDVFMALAYDWGKDGYDAPDPLYVNFYHYDSGCDITWYKHYRRGTYLHGDDTIAIIENRRLGEIIDDCIASLKGTEASEK